MNILLLDIETAPNLAYVWGMWQQNINPNQVEQSSYVLCWSAKWFGQEKLYFGSVKKSTKLAMLSRIHTMLDRADAVVHYNGRKFDIPTLNREFLIHGLNPPSRYDQIDLYQVVRARFRFESNRLDSIASRLDLGKKMDHEGFRLWTKCMAGDAKAWKTMELYNRQDVVLLEKLYKRLLPWINQHPNIGAYEDALVCTKCGSSRFQAKGYHVTKVMKYQRYHCQDCGSWFRGNRSVALKGERMVNIPA